MSTQKPTPSSRTMAIRAKAGNDGSKCCLCGRKPSNPFRAYDRAGRIVAGCVDATHTGHLVPISECSRWHNRPVANELRRNELNRISRP